jgi:hypothetical protein
MEVSFVVVEQNVWQSGCRSPKEKVKQHEDDARYAEQPSDEVLAHG